MGRQGSFIKLFTDIVISLVILIVSLPILLICMVAIKLETPGPAIFIQDRAGYKGKKFKMYKLRGMFENAHELGPELTVKDDPRVTKVGRLLRRLSIDEIPQFFNVLKGDMSIIGPRPEIISITDNYTEEQRKVFDYKPGITGYSQINGRQLLTPDERIKMELEYYAKANFFTDLIIFLKTPIIVFTNEGNL
ncbi:MAG: sugar transferase [Ignavibacteriaceae bacterium]|nr:sugar transferase [Ignavibacteriaceae bacterium]